MLESKLIACTVLYGAKIIHLKMSSIQPPSQMLESEALLMLGKLSPSSPPGPGFPLAISSLKYWGLNLGSG